MPTEGKFAGRTYELAGRTDDSVIADKSLQGQMEMEDFESWPAQGSTLLVARDKGIQEVRALKMPGTLSGHSGGSMPGRSKAEGGKEENDEEDEVRRLEKKVMHAVSTANLVESITSGVLAGVVLGTRGVVSSSSDGVDEEPLQHVNQSWECSQVENEPKERDAQDWLTDDEMMTKWEEVRKDEEEVTVRRSEGGKAATRESANCTRACDSADTNEEE